MAVIGVEVAAATGVHPHAAQDEGIMPHHQGVRVVVGASVEAASPPLRQALDTYLAVGAGPALRLVLFTGLEAAAFLRIV